MAKVTYTTFDEVMARIDLAIMSKTPITGDERSAIFPHVTTLMKEHGLVDAISLFCKKVLEIGKSDIKKFHHLENSIWSSFYTFFLFQNFIKLDKKEEFEFIEAGKVYEDEWKTVYSTILQLCYDTLALPLSNSIGCALRREKAWNMIFEILALYQIKDFQKDVFPFISRTFLSELNAALLSIGLYFELYENEIDSSLLLTVQDIFSQATEEEIAIRCLKIQLDAGLIDEDTADAQMNDWADRLGL